MVEILLRHSGPILSNEHHDAVVKCILKINEEQESIPVGCAESTAVAVGEGGVCFPRGVLPRLCVCFRGGGGCFLEGVLLGGVSQHALGRHPPPLGTESQTTTTLRAVKI